MTLHQTKSTFETHVSRVNVPELENFLYGLKTPCYESRLLRLIFPKLDILNADALTLYQHHFILFHLLYMLQDKFLQKEKHLYIHFMRTVLMDYPEHKKCRFFNETTLRFCAAACTSDHNFCAHHLANADDTALETLSIKHFYLDQANFYCLDQKTADAFINGTWELVANYDEYRDSFSILGIPETADLRMIKRKFRSLAKKYHPDHGEPCSDAFKSINRAYQLLMRIIPVIRSNPSSFHK